MSNPSPAPTFLHAALPVGFLALVLSYGLFLRPLVLEQPAMPLEVVFLLASAFAIAHLRVLGHRWQDIQESIVARMGRGVPGFFVLFAIGMLIGSWMVCGTIPMLVHWGIESIEPRWFYLLAFLVPVGFSMLTGTSWGSAGTVGVVIMGVALSIDAELPITAGAVVGGAAFGDKMSPLSDTTNMAALGAEADLFDHIRSMMWTTLPAALVASTVYAVVGFTHPPTGSVATPESREFLAGLERMFTFHWVLLLPPVVVLVGSLKRLPTIPVLGAAILLGVALAILVQPFATADVFASLTTGFAAEMSPHASVAPAEVLALVERGGLYSMREAVFVAFLVFFFIGVVDRVQAMPVVVNRLFGFARGQSATVLAALGSAGLTNAMTTNQYATSFIVGDSFKQRFDRLGIPRRVLSRSIEDTGTMIETVTPWHPTALFMASTLGVTVGEFAGWQILTIANLVIAPMLAVTGIGCWYQRHKVAE